MSDQSAGDSSTFRGALLVGVFCGLSIAPALLTAPWIVPLIFPAAGPLAPIVTSVQHFFTILVAGGFIGLFVMCLMLPVGRYFRFMSGLRTRNRGVAGQRGPDAEEDSP